MCGGRVFTFTEDRMLLALTLYLGSLLLAWGIIGTTVYVIVTTARLDP